MSYADHLSSRKRWIRTRNGRERPRGGNVAGGRVAGGREFIVMMVEKAQCAVYRGFRLPLFSQNRLGKASNEFGKASKRVWKGKLRCLNESTRKSTMCSVQGICRIFAHAKLCDQEPINEHAYLALH